VIARAYEDDSTSADAEWGGTFRQLQTAYLERSTVEAAVDDVTSRFGWVIAAFQRHGVGVTHAPLSTSEIYAHVIPQWMSKRVRMLKHRRAVDQICGLKRKVRQGGREIINHNRNAHDDLATAISGLLWRLSPATMSSGENWCEFMRRQLEEPNRWEHRHRRSSRAGSRSRRLQLHRQILADERFAKGPVDTRFFEGMRHV
jgi:hypothetical protein